MGVSAAELGGCRRIGRVPAVAHATSVSVAASSSRSGSSRAGNARAGGRHTGLVVAIFCRSFALAHPVRCEPVNGWIISAEERGMTRLHAEVTRAAAEEALVEDPIASLLSMCVASHAALSIWCSPRGGHEPARFRRRRSRPAAAKRLA